MPDLSERIRHSFDSTPSVTLEEMRRRADLRRASRPPRARRLVAIAFSVAVVFAAAVLVATRSTPDAHHSPGRTSSTRASSSSPVPSTTATTIPRGTTTTTQLVIGNTTIPAGFVPEKLVSASVSALVLQAPPRQVIWRMNGTCQVNQSWLVVPKGGSRGGGGLGGTCPFAPHLSVVSGELGGNGALFLVVGGHVLPATGVRVVVVLANGASMTFEPHNGLWMSVIERCGDYAGTVPRTIELVTMGGTLISKQRFTNSFESRSCS